MSKRIALITGITGQDGSYLAEFLLKKDSPPTNKRKQIRTIMLE